MKIYNYPSIASMLASDIWVAIYIAFQVQASRKALCQLNIYMFLFLLRVKMDVVTLNGLAM